MNRPYVILNAAMTLDGKISTTKGDSRISCDEDLDRVHRLRKEVDAIMVGIGTVLADDSRLTVRKVEGENPIRVVVDSDARVPSEARVLDESSDTIVAVSEKADKDDLERLRSLNAQVVVKGKEEVDLPELLEVLSDQDVKKLLLEGGSELNWSMLSLGLVDEVRVAVHPVIVGGRGAKSLAEGKGFERVSEGIELDLVRTREVGEDLLLIYEVRESSSD